MKAAATLGGLSVVLAAPRLLGGEQINPYPRRQGVGAKLYEWDFASGVGGWKALHDCTLAAADGVLTITSTGNDPYLAAGVKLPATADIILKLRARFSTGAGGQVFWTTAANGGTTENRSTRFRIAHDGKWREYSVPLGVRGSLTSLRLDPGAGPGTAEVDWIRLYAARMHPLEIVRVDSTGREVVLDVRNHSAAPVDFSLGGRQHTVRAGKILSAAVRPAGDGPFEVMQLSVASPGAGPLNRNVAVYRSGAKAGWLLQTSESITLHVAKDGSGAVLRRDGKVVAILAPLVHRDGAVPKLSVAQDARGIRLAGSGLASRLSLAGDELTVDITSDAPVEGPVLRAIGPLEQGIFAGLEYLGKAERSSSRLDIETDEHLRFAPDPLKVTMPLMAVVTDRVTAAMTWKDMALQPRFASPNFVDGAADHRMSLEGKKISTTILLSAPGPITDAILWSVKKRGLPALPKAPRSRAEQWALCMKAFNGPLKGKGGWGHCIEARWPRRFYAAHADAIWRLTGRAPDVPEIVAGGGHIRSEAVFFVTGRGRQWAEMARTRARGLIARQKPDGSYRYEGKYRRGHFEDTATGVCARPAADLLDYARQTGDPEALAAGLRTLEYMKRFRTPRGAQFWELSIHTPDILAAAHLVRAYVRAYELTGKAEHLALARQWALSGVPFVYLWGRYPTMTYATTPVFGATNWRAPNWIGRPVQWCGISYAHALTLLAPHDETLDWNHLARGILISGERQQYPDGDRAGCLPDVFVLPEQHRAGPSINPSALVVLRRALAGEAATLAVATAGGRRVLSPFPVTIREGKAHIHGRKGVKYQVLVDGTRVMEIDSRGSDVVSLD